MNNALHSTLTSLESSLTALLSSLTSSPTASSAPAATVALLESDDALTTALNTLRTHQTNYARILKLRAEAGRLEERVKGIVREIGDLGGEIEEARGGGYGEDGDMEDSELSDEETEVHMATKGGTEGGARKRKTKEVDYKTLLDFATRISRYNVHAAADAAAGIGKKPPQTDGGNAEEQRKDEGLAAVTQEATMWLDETANQTRDAWLLPYPSEDRIRMGLMGQLQAVAAEQGVEVEKEVEKLIKLAAEGGDITVPVAGGQAEGAGMGAPAPGMYEPGQPVEGISNGGAVPFASGPPQMPKATFDLDLYDPDADD